MRAFRHALQFYLVLQFIGMRKRAGASRSWFINPVFDFCRFNGGVSVINAAENVPFRLSWPSGCNRLSRPGLGRMIRCSDYRNTPEGPRVLTTKVRGNPSQCLAVDCLILKEFLDNNGSYSRQSRYYRHVYIYPIDARGIRFRLLALEITRAF